MKVLKKIGDWNVGILDNDNVCVYKEAITQAGPNAGKQVRSHIKYYATMEQALNKLCDVAARSEAKSLQQYVDIMRSTAATLAQACSTAPSQT